MRTTDPKLNLFRMDTNMSKTTHSRKTQTATRCAGAWHRMVLHAALAAALIGMLPPAARSSEQTDTEITSTRECLANWVENRRAIAEERRKWAETREFLNNRIQLVQQEIDSLRGKIAELKKNITETDTKRQSLVTENEKLEQASSSLKGVIAGLETRCKQLLTQMPKRVREKVTILSQQLPADPAKETDLSLSQRFQNVLGIMNALNKFSRDITVSSEILDLPGTGSVEVAVIYLGLSQAYYVSGNGQIAGIGRSSGQDWTWTPDNQIAPQVNQVLAIFKNEQPATFVKLPLTTK